MAKSKNAQENGDRSRVRIPRQIETVRLNGAYSGLEFDIWVNPTMKVWQGLRDRPTSSQDYLTEMIVAWNFDDDAGNPIPIPKEGGWDYIPVDLVMLIDAAAGAKIEEITQVPKESAEP